MKKMSHHTDLLRELVTSLLTRGIQIAEMSKLGCLICLVKHAIGLIPCISCTCRYFQFLDS
jgi:hypothetical protein